MPIPLQTVIAGLECLPPAAEVFVSLQKVLRDLDSDTGDIVDLVKLDGNLTAQVIKVSNSAFYGGQHACDNLTDAVNCIGFFEVHRLVGALVSQAVLGGVVPAYELGEGELWRYSLAVATAAEHLAGSAGENRESGYTAGLLHAVGMVAVNRHFVRRGVEFFDLTRPRSTLPEQERAVLGFHSGVVGAALLRSWSFPERTCAAVESQFEPETAPEGAARRLASILHLAKWVATSLQAGRAWGDPEEPWNFKVMESLRLNEKHLERCLDATASQLDRSLAFVAA